MEGIKRKRLTSEGLEVGELPDIESDTKTLLKKIGPGLVWSAAAIGTGELILITRNSAMYGLRFAWMIVFLIFIKFFINYEVGRYTVLTGQPIMGGIAKASKILVFWFAFLPIAWQVITISTYCVNCATLLQWIFGGRGSLAFMATIIALLTGLILYFGRYDTLEKFCTIGTSFMTLCILISAIVFTPGKGYGELFLNIIMPKLPQNPQAWTDMTSLTGFVGAGCVGTIWYSYWLKEKGYGFGLNNNKKDEKGIDVAVIPGETPEEVRKGKGRMKMLRLDLGIGTILTLVVCLSFFLCGYAILQPRGLVPEGLKVVLVQAQIMVQLIGPIGEWIYVIVAIEVMFATYLAFQDGTSRMWDDASRILVPKLTTKYDKRKTYRFWVTIFTIQCLISLIVTLKDAQPLLLLQAQSILDGAYNLPILSVVVLIVNLKILPKIYKPTKWCVFWNIVGIVFFSIFAIFYTTTLV